MAAAHVVIVIFSPASLFPVIQDRRRCVPSVDGDYTSQNPGYSTLMIILHILLLPIYKAHWSFHISRLTLHIARMQSIYRFIYSRIAIAARYVCTAESCISK